MVRLRLQNLYTKSHKIQGFNNVKNNKKHSTFKIQMSIPYSVCAKYRRKEIYGQLKRDIGEMLENCVNKRE